MYMAIRYKSLIRSNAIYFVIIGFKKFVEYATIDIMISTSLVELFKTCVWTISNMSHTQHSLHILNAL